MYTLNRDFMYSPTHETIIEQLQYDFFSLAQKFVLVNTKFKRLCWTKPIVDWCLRALNHAWSICVIFEPLITARSEI